MRKFTCFRRILAISRWSLIAAIWSVVNPSLFATFKISPAFARSFSTALLSWTQNRIMFFKKTEIKLIATEIIIQEISSHLILSLLILLLLFIYLFLIWSNSQQTLYPIHTWIKSLISFLYEHPSLLSCFLIFFFIFFLSFLVVRTYLNNIYERTAYFLLGRRTEDN